MYRSIRNTLLNWLFILETLHFGGLQAKFIFTADKKKRLVPRLKESVFAWAGDTIM